MKSKYIISGILLLVVVTFVCLSSFTKTNEVSNEIAKSDEGGISFIEQDWSKALQQAKDENKLVFLDIYATWCGPCKLLKKNTFSKAEVGDFFNANFVNVSVDGEEGVGPTLAQQFSISGYPTLIIADKTGKPILFTMGYMDANELLAFAKDALKKKP